MTFVVDYGFKIVQEVSSWTQMHYSNLLMTLEDLAGVLLLIGSWRAGFFKREKFVVHVNFTWKLDCIALLFS